MIERTPAEQAVDATSGPVLDAEGIRRTMQRSRTRSSSATAASSGSCSSASSAAA